VSLGRHRELVLEAVGLNLDLTDPVVLTAFDEYPWRALNHPKTSRPADPDVTRRYAAVGMATGRTSITSGNKRPWQHISKAEILDVIAKALQAAVDAAEPVECEQGACVACAVRVAAGWVDYEIRTPAPYRRPLVLCGDCSKVWERASQAFGDPAWPDLLVADCLGLPSSVMNLAWTLEFAPAYEAAPDVLDAGGTDQRFGYIDPEVMDAARAFVWKIYPRLAPDEWRIANERLAAEEAVVEADLLPPPAMVVPGRRSA
jgi:hypothetical protein